MTQVPRSHALLVMPVVALAASVGVFGIGRGLAMVTIAALFGGPFTQVYTGAAITADAAMWLGCVGIIGMRVLRPGAERISKSASPHS